MEPRRGVDRAESVLAAGGSALELEGIVGGAHVAVGNNVAYGGSIDARSHIDCVLLEATLELDGEQVDPR